MPHARSTDPQTSHEAAQSVTNVTALQSAILSAMSLPMTDVELVEIVRMRHSKPVSESGIRSRRAELVQAGYVKDTGERVKLPSGRRAIVWERA